MNTGIKRGVSLLLLAFGIIITSLQSANAGAIALPWKKEHSDALRVFQFLNYIDLALAETIETEDSLLLARNYDILSDNIDLAEVRDEQVINVIEALGKLVDRTETNRMTEKVIDIYEKRLTESIYSGIEISGSLERSILRQIPDNPSPWMDYYTNRDIYKNLMTKKVKITSKQLREITELRKEMLRISWELFNKYEVGKRELISSSDIDRFIQIIGSKDPSLISRQLRRLLKDQPSFESFPPFWFHYGMAEKRQGSPSRHSFALTCFDRYIGTYRGIFKKDPILLVTAMERISLLPRRNRVQRIKNLEIIKDNASSTDWQFFLFSAVINSQMGLIPQAREDLQRNIDDGKQISLCRRVMGNTLLEARDYRGFKNAMTTTIKDKRAEAKDILSLVAHCRSVECKDWLISEVQRLKLSIAGSNEWASRVSIPDSWIDVPCTIGIEITGESFSGKTSASSSDIKVMLPNEERSGRLIEIYPSVDTDKDSVPLELIMTIDHPLYSLSTRWQVKTMEKGLGQNLKLTLGKIMTFYKPEVARYEMTSFSISGKEFQIIAASPDEPVKATEPDKKEKQSPDISMTEISRDSKISAEETKETEELLISSDIEISQDMEEEKISIDIEESSIDTDLPSSEDELLTGSEDKRVKVNKEER